MENTSSARTENSSSTLVVPTYCGVSDEIEQNVVFWIEGVLLSVIGLMGVFGNTITSYVLSLIPSTYNILNKLLMQLLSGDSIFIILAFIDFSLRKTFHVLTFKDDIYASVWPKFLYPFLKISDTWITFVTIAITVER